MMKVFSDSPLYQRIVAERAEKADQAQSQAQQQPKPDEPITPIVPVVIVHTFGQFQNVAIVKDWRVAMHVLIDGQANDTADHLFIHIATEF